jgi:hypothetical protein
VLERGGRIPQLDTILKLSSGLSISPDELIEGTAWKPGEFSPGSFDLTEWADNTTAPARSEPH